MRFISSEVHIAATPEQVWSVLVDFAAYEQWNPLLISVQGQAVPGTKLRGRFRLPDGKEFPFRPKILDVEPERLLRWRGKLGIRGLFDGVHLFELSARDGGTWFVQSERFTGVLVPFSPSIIRQSQEQFHAFNKALKARVEESSH